MDRPKRSVSKKAKQPSTTYYVGYVEDNETPEMIMKKFEALERLQANVTASTAPAAEEEGAEGGGAGPSAAAAAAGGEEGAPLTEEQLMEVFKQTSQFTLKAALTGEVADAYFGEEGGAGGFVSDDDEDWGNDDDEDFWGTGGGEGRKKRAPGIIREPKEKPEKLPREPKAQQKHQLTAYNRDNQMLLRRKKVVDPYELVLIKMPPPPLPTSWGRVIAPYKSAPPVVDYKKIETKDIFSLDPSQVGTDFLGVLLNPPWKMFGAAAGIKASALSRLRLPQLCPHGFIFIWVEKETLDEVVDVLSLHGYVYVENLTWVILQPNNRVAELSADYLGRSHRTLLIFRRDMKEHPQGRAIELRHQRSPDVDMSIGRTGADGRLMTPEAAYQAIETLLPGGYTAGQGKPGKFLELWGHEELRRTGWTSVVCK